MNENEPKIGELEALLFAANRPLSIPVLSKQLGLTEDQTVELVRCFQQDLSTPRRGLQLREMRGRWRLETKPEHAQAIQLIRAERGERSFSAQALETLAVIALRQPVTTEQISTIRGRDSSGTIETLRKRKLIARELNRSEGKALCWRTTQNFLDLFGLSGLEDLYRENKLGDIFGPVYGSAGSRSHSAPNHSESQ